MPAFAGMTLKRQFLRAPATTTASRTRTAAATGCSAKASIRRASTGSLPGSCTGSADDNFLVIPTQVGIQSSALAGMTSYRHDPLRRARGDDELLLPQWRLASRGAG